MPSQLLTRTGAMLATLVLALSLVTAGAFAAPANSRATRTVPGCHAAQLTIVRGMRLGSAGHRYNRFRITNTGPSTCRLFGYPTFWFLNRDGRQIGHRSTPAGQRAHVVVLRPATHTRVQVGTVDPGVITVPGACRPRQARWVDLMLAYRPHVYKVPLRLRVCTTRQYRPTSYPVGF